MDSIDKEWYRDFFHDRYLQIALANTARRTALECDFITQALDIEPPARVLDLACGHGRHALELARRGYVVTGVDLSQASIDHASRDAAEAGIDVNLIQQDMRQIDFDSEFDLVINMFTAFGYFADEADDLHVLSLVARALKPKGSLLLDVANTVRIFREYRPQGHSILEDGTTMLEEATYDAATGRNNVVWSFIATDGTKTHLGHSVRMYTLPELLRLLESAGLIFERAWGDFEGSAFDAFTSRRLIIKAVRP